MMKQYDAGIQGEFLAEEWLTQRGMQSIARRYRGQDGEIDLIMLDGDMVVFVEVKYRPNAMQGDGLLSITPAKQRRLTHAAQDFLLTQGWTERQARFDVVEITKDGVLHIPNAFYSLY